MLGFVQADATGGFDICVFDPEISAAYVKRELSRLTRSYATGNHLPVDMLRLYLTDELLSVSGVNNFVGTLEVFKFLEHAEKDKMEHMCLLVLVREGKGYQRHDEIMLSEWNPKI